MERTILDVSTRSWAAYIGIGIAYVPIAIWVLLLMPDSVFPSLGLIPIFAWLTMSDLTHRTIPDLASTSIAAFGLALPILRGGTPDPTTILMAVVLLGVLWGLSELYWRRTRCEALGLGDIKLISALCLLVGHDQIWSVILFASVGGIAATVMSKAATQRGVPFGPFLAYAAQLCLVLNWP